MVRERFGSDNDFMLKVNPNTQPYFGRNVKTAVMGDYPTLADIDAAYGDNYSSEWLLPHIANLALSVGAKNLTIEQEVELATIIATEYRFIKITEILLFFYRFKAGYYGKFYGNVDPMVITCALRDFNQEMSIFRHRYEQEEKMRFREEELKTNPPITQDEYLKLKQQKGNGQ